MHRRLPWGRIQYSLGCGDTVEECLGQFKAHRKGALQPKTDSTADSLGALTKKTTEYNAAEYRKYPSMLKAVELPNGADSQQRLW